jgi:hypothetical protein
VLIGAGLPQIHGLAGNSKFYAERLFRFPDIGVLDHEDAIAAIANPAKLEGVSFDDQAIERILELTERYPYFLQQWAYEAWNAWYRARHHHGDDARHRLYRLWRSVVHHLDQSNPSARPARRRSIAGPTRRRLENSATDVAGSSL